jgi:hypothetical protein
MTLLQETIITIPRIKHRIKVRILSGYESPCWDVERETPYGWERIPAMSRAECRRFPKSVGYAANAILKQWKEAHT